MEQRPAGPDGANEYVFYDGPPFANGLPHYGHLLTGYVKDAVPRYQTMRGRRVERRFGWDCHGLPAETEAEKELGVSGRGPITEYGIDRFNDYCRTSVLRYTHEWERYVTRQARWVDFRHDYKTMDLSYMESVMWALKQLWDKGLLYEGYRVLPYCWECETPLSNFETRQDDAYRDRQDPAVTVAFELDPVEGEAPTCPLGVDDHAVDAAVQPGPGRRARPRLRRLRARRCPHRAGRGHDRGLPVPARRGPAARNDQGGRAGRPQLPSPVRLLRRHAQRLPGAGRRLRQHRRGHRRSSTWRPASARTTSGCARRPASPSSARSTTAAASPPRSPTTRAMQVFEANTPIIRDLRAAGALVRADSYVHSYPHCWRTDTPLIYKAVSSWFVRVTAFRDRMVELNQQISWVPAARARRGIRQMAGKCPRLVDLAQPLLGFAHSGLEK